MLFALANTQSEQPSRVIVRAGPESTSHAAASGFPLRDRFTQIGICQVVDAGTDAESGFWESASAVLPPVQLTFTLTSGMLFWVMKLESMPSTGLPVAFAIVFQYPSPVALPNAKVFRYMPMAAR